MPFHHVADSGHFHPAAYLHQNNLLVDMLLNEIDIVYFLLLRAVGQPLVVLEHEDIGPEYGSAACALGQISAAHLEWVNFREKLVLLNFLAGETLQVVQTAVDL